MVQQQILQRLCLLGFDFFTIGTNDRAGLATVWQPGISRGCITIVPSGFFSPTSTRHIRQLATTDKSGCQQLVWNLDPGTPCGLDEIVLWSTFDFNVVYDYCSTAYIPV